MIGVVGPDPDGTGALLHRAQRLTYNADGQVTKAESGTVTSQTDTAWTGFSSLEAVETAYNANARPVTQKLTSGTTAYALTQSSYDSLGRVDCTAQRMNTAAYGTLPTSACTLGTTGSFGADRITKMAYDAASRPLSVTTGFNTAAAAVDATVTYTSNGQVGTIKDAENNLTTNEYDGFDRHVKTRFPVPTKGANTSSTSDYLHVAYDANGNLTGFRDRRGQTGSFAYDFLNRPTAKNLWTGEPSLTYEYDLLGRLTVAKRTSTTDPLPLSFTYDALGRNLTQTSPQGAVTSTWDTAGRRTKLTYADGFFVNYDYLVTGDMTKVRENGATSGVGVLATYAYDNLGRRTSVTFGNGVVQASTFDPVSRLASLSNDLASTTNDLSATFAYNPASQITSTTRNGDPYAWTGHFNENKAGAPNGLNQLTSYGAKSLSHDTDGNVTAFGAKSFIYSSENLLMTGPNSTTLSYDPAMRLYQVASGASTTRFAYDGLDRIAEYDGSNALQRRYVHGPGIDDPIVWYEGTDTTNRRFLSADERGSIISVTDSTGGVLGINRYDEYGQPQGPSGAGTHYGKWGYTGQAWVPEIGEWYYKARFYDPELGRFLQPDPIGYDDGLNLYAYVGNDPVNFVDPYGLSEIQATNPACQPGEDPAAANCEYDDSQTIFVTGTGLIDVSRLWVLPELGPEQGVENECGVRAAPGECGIVVTGRRRTSAPLVLAGSQRGGNNMLSQEYANLTHEQLQERYKKAKGAERVKLQRELKARNLKNKGKVRGGGLMRIFPWWLMNTDVLEKILLTGCKPNEPCIA